MTTKTLFALIIMLFCCSIFAQTKVYSFNEVQYRNKVQKWEKFHKIDDRVVYFSPVEIDLTIDKYYHLDIVSTTFLPNNGVIYLCKDEEKNNVTVTLIDNDKMFLYNDSKRYMINFKTQAAISSVSKTYADAED